MDRIEKILVFVVVATIVVIVTLALSNSGEDPVEDLQAAKLPAEGTDPGTADLPLDLIEGDDLIDPKGPGTQSGAESAGKNLVPTPEVKKDPVPAPAPAPKAEPARKKPAEKWDEKYVVKKNDSFWSIAKAKYGNGKYWRQIWDANKDVDADNLRPKTVLVLPRIEKAAQATREPKLNIPGKSEYRYVKLKKGEYIYAVLRREKLLKRYREILRLNNLDEPSAQTVKEGFTLKLPKK